MALDMAAIEDTVLRIIQKKTSPRWSQQHHSLEAIKEAILGGHLYRPRTKLWYVGSAVGNDTTGNGGENKPYATIGKAEAVATAYDTILAWGSFAEQVTINLAGLRVMGIGPVGSIWGGDTVLLKDPMIISANGVEITGFKLDYEIANGKLIDLSADDADIHHNTMESASLGQAIKGADSQRNHIHDNVILGAGGQDLPQIQFIRSAGLCDRNRIIDNVIVGGRESIRIDQTGGAGFTRSQIKDNILMDYADYALNFILASKNAIWKNLFVGSGSTLINGAAGQWIRGNEYSIKTTGTHTTTGVAEEDVFISGGVQDNDRVSGYLRLNNLIAGPPPDDFTIRTYKSYNNGVTWDIIDETNLLGAQIIARYNFDLTFEDIEELARVTIQRASLVDRAFYHKRTWSDK